MARFKLAPMYECEMGRESGRTERITLRKRERCRQCGRYINAGEEALLFERIEGHYRGFGGKGLLHTAPCAEVVTTEVREEYEWNGMRGVRMRGESRRVPLPLEAA